MFGNHPLLPLKLLKTNNIELDFDLTHCLGAGANGASFKINNRRVLKLSVSFDTAFDFETPIKYLMENADPAFANVFDHKTIFTNLEYTIHYHILEKLLPISSDEAKVFHTLLSHEDRNIQKNYSAKEMYQITQSLSYGIDFDAEMVRLFCEDLKRSKIQHLDIHERNIMKTNSGSFKMIDFDRLSLREKT